MYRSLAVGLLSSLSLLFAQSPILTRDQLRSDARTFLRLLEETHPDPYSGHGGRLAFKRGAARLLENLPKDGLPADTLAERLNAFLVPLHDEHSGVRGADSADRDPAPWLPIAFQQTVEGLVVAATDLPEWKDCIGFRVVGVGGRSLEDLIQARNMNSENVYGTRQRMANVLRSRKFLGQTFPPRLLECEGCTYQLLDREGRPVIRRATWAQASTKPSREWAHKGTAAMPLILPKGEFPKAVFGKVGYLGIRSMMGRDACEFALREKMGQARAMLDGELKRLERPVPVDAEVALRELPSLFETAWDLLEEMRAKGCRDLVIDLQGNGGGFTPIIFPVLYLLYGDEAYGHRFPGEYATRVSELYLKKRNVDLPTLARQANNPELALGDFLFDEEDGPAGSPQEARKARLASYRQKGCSWVTRLESLDGKPLWRPERVLVLTDPGTFSAAFHATAYLRELGAKVVGVPPRQGPNAFMEVTPFELPASGLRGSISSSQQVFLPQDPKATVFPVDHPLTYAQFAHFGFDRDAGLHLALELLK